MDHAQFSKRSPGRLVATSESAAAFVPDPLPPKLELGWKTLSLLEEAGRGLGELAGVGGMLPNPQLLIRPYMKREAILSSQIEDKFATMQQLALFDISAEPENADVQEVANYVAALEYGLNRVNELPVSLRLIRELHERLLMGVRGEGQRPGEFRTRQNFIGRLGQNITEARYVPPPPAELMGTLYDFEAGLHATWEFPLLVKIALTHYQFEAIHPFNDGNGRIGRLLITLQLHQEGLLPSPLLYLSAFFEAHQASYYDRLLAVSQNGEWEEWIAFFLQGVAEQSRDAVRRTRRVLALREEFHHRVQTPRGSALLTQLIDELLVVPAVTASQVRKLLGITHRSAQRNIEKLEQAGILKEITGHARNRVYVAYDILAVLEAPSA